MIKDELLEMSWNVSNKSYYINRGYTFTKIGDKFLIHSKDLKSKSRLRVTCICDECGYEWKTRRDIAQDICLNCKNKNREGTWKPFEVDILKEEYSGCNDIAEIGLKLGRSKNAVQLKASELGLKRNFKTHKYVLDYYDVSREKLGLEMEIIAYLMGDGWLSGCVRKKVDDSEYIQYNCGFSGEIAGLKKIQEDLENLYGERCFGEISSRESDSAKYGIKGITNQFIVNNGVINRFIKLGVPIGKRVEKNFLISDFMDLDNIELCKKYLSGFYNAEGTKISLTSCGRSFRTPSLIITKRLSHIENLKAYIKELELILEHLELDYNVKYERTKTKEKNIKVRIVFKNNYSNMLKLLNIVDFKYAPSKVSTDIIAYFLLKAYCTKKEFVRNADQFSKLKLLLNDNQNKIIDTLKDKYQNEKYHVYLPKNFCTFDEFVKMY